MICVHRPDQARRGIARFTASRSRQLLHSLTTEDIKPEERRHPGQLLGRPEFRGCDLPSRETLDTSRGRDQWVVPPVGWAGRKRSFIGSSPPYFRCALCVSAVLLLSAMRGNTRARPERRPPGIHAAWRLGAPARPWPFFWDPMPRSRHTPFRSGGHTLLQRPSLAPSGARQRDGLERTGPDALLCDLQPSQGEKPRATPIRPARCQTPLQRCHGLSLGPPTLGDTGRGHPWRSLGVYPVVSVSPRRLFLLRGWKEVGLAPGAGFRSQ